LALAGACIGSIGVGRGKSKKQWSRCSRRENMEQEENRKEATERLRRLVNSNFENTEVVRISYDTTFTKTKYGLADALMLAIEFLHRDFTGYMQDEEVSWMEKDERYYKKYQSAIDNYFAKQKMLMSPLSEEQKQKLSEVMFTDEAGLVEWLRKYGWRMWH
jgi:uncharacterized protein YnzC (UPF0291/DUF896 family)